MLISATHEAALQARPIAPVLFAGVPPSIPAVLTFVTQQPLLAFQQDNPDAGVGEAVGATLSAGLYSGGVPRQALPLLTTLQLPSEHPRGFMQGSLLPMLATTTVVVNMPVFVVSARHTEHLSALPNASFVGSGTPPLFVPAIPAPQWRRLFARQIEQPEVVNYSFFFRGYLYRPLPPPPYPGPYILLQDAIRILVNAGFVVNPLVQYVFSTLAPAGYVIAQSPAAHTNPPFSATISLTVSKGPQPIPGAVTVPFLSSSMSIVDAADLIMAAGCTLAYPVFATFSTSLSVPSGYIISQSPPGSSSVVAGTAVSIVVSVGPPVIYPSHGTLFLPGVAPPP